jgi:ribonucleotide reductase alpha subunit
MMAHCQPYLSGAISKTINLPEEATVADISDVYLYGYYSGLKAIAVYRDKSKVSSVMYTDKEDQGAGGRKPLDLNSHHFDIREVFGGQFPHVEDYVPQENVVGEESASAIEMPTYGCKDGACSI